MKGALGGSFADDPRRACSANRLLRHELELHGLIGEPALQELRIVRAAEDTAGAAGPDRFRLHGAGTRFHYRAVRRTVAEHEPGRSGRAHAVRRRIDRLEAAVGRDRACGRDVEGAAERMLEHDAMQSAPAILGLVRRAEELRTGGQIERRAKASRAPSGLK